MVSFYEIYDKHDKHDKRDDFEFNIAFNIIFSTTPEEMKKNILKGKKLAIVLIMGQEKYTSTTALE